EAFRDQLRKELLGFIDSATGRQVVSAVHTRDEVFAGPHADLAPDLTLELEDGGLVSIVAAEQADRPPAGPAGPRRPEGVFVARGPGMHKGVDLGTLSILDVAPLLLESLGVPSPADLEGRVAPGLFESRRAVRDGAAARSAAPVAAEPGDVDGVSLDPEAEK